MSVYGWKTPWLYTQTKDIGETGLSFTWKLELERLERILDQERAGIVKQWVLFWKIKTCVGCTESSGYGNSTQFHTHTDCPTHGDRGRKLVAEAMRKDEAKWPRWMIIQSNDHGYDQARFEGTLDECEAMLPSFLGSRWHLPWVMPVREDEKVYVK